LKRAGLNSPRAGELLFLDAALYVPSSAVYMTKVQNLQGYDMPYISGALGLDTLGLEVADTAVNRGKE